MSEIINSFDINHDDKIDGKDINLLGDMLSKVDNQEKNRIIEGLFETELKKEDREKIANLLKQKLKISKVGDYLKKDDNGVNNYLYKALVWIENEKTAKNVLIEKEREENLKNQQKLDRIVYNYTNNKNFNRLLGRLKSIPGFKEKPLIEINKKISYLDKSDLNDDEKKDLILKFNKGLKEIEQKLHYGEESKINSSNINKKIKQILEIFPEELDISLYGAGKEIASAISNAGNTIYEDIKNALLKSGRKGFSLSEIKNFLTGMSTSDWLALPKKILNAAMEWGEDVFNEIEGFFRSIPNFLSGTYKTVEYIRVFIEKIVPKIIELYGPFQLLKLFKFPGLIGKVIQGSKIIKRGKIFAKRAQKLAKYKISLFTSEKLLPYINKIAPEKLLKLISKGELDSLMKSSTTTNMEKYKILRHIKDKLANTETIKKTKEYYDEINKINYYLKSMNLNLNNNGQRS